MGVDRLMPIPPQGKRLYVERVRVDAVCPECGSDNVARYPIANYIGPRIATKCQDCFHALAVDVPTEEDHWPPWRTVTLDWPASRAG